MFLTSNLDGKSIFIWSSQIAAALLDYSSTTKISISSNTDTTIYLVTQSKLRQVAITQPEPSLIDFSHIQDSLLASCNYMPGSEVSPKTHNVSPCLYLHIIKLLTSVNVLIHCVRDSALVHLSNAL